MLTFGEMDSRNEGSIGEGECSGLHLEHMRDLVNSYAMGCKPDNVSVELVDTENLDGDVTTGLYIVTPRWRAFVLLFGHRLMYRAGVADTATRADAAWNADWTCHALAKEWLMAKGSRTLTRDWLRETAVALRGEERTRHDNYAAIANTAEDPRNWEQIPDDVRIEAYVWKFDEVTH